jgi:hypothetical protein
MKVVIIYISLFFFILPAFMYGQCLSNGNFSNACSETDYADRGCPTWTENCGDGWIRSHGTPNLGTYTYQDKGQTKVGYYAFLYSGSSTTGEGMFTPYNFKAHHTYTLSIDISVSVDALGDKDAWVLIYAANGLVQGNYNNRCEDPIPDVSKFEIGKYSGSGTNGWTTMSFTFAPDADYTQLWIYPVRIKGYQVNLSFKSVSLCPSCEGEIFYGGGLIPAGISKAGKIFAGGPGVFGNGVNIHSDATTNLMAAQEIEFFSELEAFPTTGSLTAEIYACTQSSARTESVTSKPAVPVKLAPIEAQTDINIYPSITTGHVYITRNRDLGNVVLEIYDQAGRKMLNVPKTAFVNSSTLDLSNFSNGIYFLRIKKPGTSITKKIIVQK